MTAFVRINSHNGQVPLCFSAITVEAPATQNRVPTPVTTSQPQWQRQAKSGTRSCDNRSHGQPHPEARRSVVGSGTGAVTGKRPVSSARPSNRACGSPAHGSPTSFTAGIRSSPPGPVGPGGDDDSIKADQAELVG